MIATTTRTLRAGPILSAGFLLGIGLGGFLDGIVLHQILQWHNMLASVVPPADVVSIKVNMFWDGLFHAFTWTTTMIGLVLLFRAGRWTDVPWSGRVLGGAMAIGWGAFNLVEGVIDHHVLGVHHVRPGDAQLAWDLGFLAFGATLVLVGVTLVRAGRRAAEPERVLVPGRISHHPAE